VIGAARWLVLRSHGIGARWIPATSAATAAGATIAAGLLLIAVPLAFNVALALLAARFDYPDILRRPTAEVLQRFRAGGTSLVLTWWAFALTAVLMVPLVVLLSQAVRDADPALVSLATTTGVLAAAVQAVGLVRWPFVVPYLARTHADAPDTVDVVFQALHRYLGVAVGEHLGYALTGAWTALAGVALTQSSAVPAAFGIAGIVIGPVLMLCSLEFAGPHERDGWKLAGALTPVTYVVWSLWLVATGIALLA
jgi:hypothetical protein